jgi:hypothetical protein
MQRRWETIQGKTATRLEELLEAEQLAEELLRAVGEKQQAPAVTAEASALHARAFTLLLRAYDERRRARRLGFRVAIRSRLREASASEHPWSL